MLYIWRVDNSLWKEFMPNQVSLFNVPTVVMKSQAMILGIVLTLVLWFLLIVLFPILYGFFIAPVIAILISWLLYRKSKRHAIATIPDNLVSFIPPEEIAVRTFRKAMK